MTDYERSSRRSDRKKSGVKHKLKIFLIIIGSLILLSAGVLGYMTYQLSQVANATQTDLDRGERSSMRDITVDPVNDPISILFLGLDTRDGDLSGRTDSMILTTFNPNEKSVRMLSLPRDSYVPIIGRDTHDKLNHAHAFGGLNMTVDTVEAFLDVPVDYVVTLNFDAFMDIVDAIGGVEVDVPMPIYDRDNATYGEISIDEGIQTLDGEEALAYARMRKQDPRGDHGRGDRQKDIIEAIIKQSVNFQTITNFNSVMDSLEDNLSMNLSFGQLISMHGYARGLNDIESMHLEGSDTTIDGIYYYQVDDSSLQQISRSFRDHLELP